jgi:predicted nucleotidyltransferase
MQLIESHKKEIEKLCLKNKVKVLYAFGSVLTKKFNYKSDVDFLVDFDPMDLELYADNYYRLKFGLQDILKRPVDLLEERAMKNPFLIAHLNQEKQIVYEHRS